MERTPNNPVLTDVTQEIKSRKYIHEKPLEYIEYDAREMEFNSCRTSLDSVNMVDEKAFLDKKEEPDLSAPKTDIIAETTQITTTANTVNLVPLVQDASIPTFIQNPVATTSDQVMNQRNGNEPQYVRHYENKYDYGHTAGEHAKTVGASYLNYNFINTDAGAGFYSFKNAMSFMGVSVGKGFDNSYADRQFMDFASQNGFSSSHKSRAAQYNDFKNQVLKTTIESMDRGQHAANQAVLAQAQASLNAAQSTYNAQSAALKSYSGDKYTTDYQKLVNAKKNAKEQLKQARKEFGNAEFNEINSRPYELSQADIAFPFNKMARNNLSSEKAILAKALYNELNVNAARGGIKKDKETGKYYVIGKDANTGEKTSLYLTNTETAQYELFKSLERQEKHNEHFTFNFKPISKETFKGQFKQQFSQTDAGAGMSQLRASWHQFSTFLGAPVYKGIGRGYKIAASKNLKKMQNVKLYGAIPKKGIRFNGFKKKPSEWFSRGTKVLDENYFSRKYNRNMRVSRFMQGPKAWAQDGSKWLLRHSKIGRKYLNTKDLMQKATKEALKKFLVKTKLAKVISLLSKLMAPILPTLAGLLIIIVIINLLIPVSWLEDSDIDVNAVINKMCEAEGQFMKDVEFTYDITCNELDENGNKLHPYHTAEINAFSGDRDDDFNNLDLATLTDQNATHCRLISQSTPSHLEMRQYDTVTLYKTIIAMQHARQDLFWEDGIFSSEAKQGDVEEYCIQLLKKILYTCVSTDANGRIQIRINHTGLTNAMRLDEEKITSNFFSAGSTSSFDEDDIGTNGYGYEQATFPIYKDGLTHRPNIWSVIGSFFKGDEEFDEEIEAWHSYLDGYWSKYHRDELEIVRELWEMTDEEWLEMGIQLPTANELTGNMGPSIDYATLQEVETSLMAQGLNPYRIKVIITALKECGKHIYGLRSAPGNFPFKLDCSDFVSGALLEAGVPGAVDATCYGIVDMAKSSLNQAYSVKHNAARNSKSTRELLPGDIMVKNETQGKAIDGRVSSQNHVVIYIGAIPGYGEHCVIECTTRCRKKYGNTGTNVITGVAVSGFNTIEDLLKSYDYQFIIDPYGLCPDEIDEPDDITPDEDDIVPQG